MNEIKRIKCPYCGAEYLPEEIFVSGEVFQKPKVLKDEFGRIEFTDRDDEPCVEEYECDYCHNLFKVTLDMQFSTKLMESFTEEFDMAFSDDLGIWK